MWRKRLRPCDVSRRHFLIATKAGVGAAALWGTGFAVTARAEIKPADSVAPEFPRQLPSSVRAVVGASHFDLSRVTQLVNERPALAKASWDWGFGDWESAVGAASHVGRRDIAEVLIAHGARPDLFALTMLGKIDAVRATIRAMPGIQRVPGPHGITLLRHARNRIQRSGISSEDRENVSKTIEYLESLGDADIAAPSLNLPENARQVYEGTYRFGDRPDDVFVMSTNRSGDLVIRRADQPARGLNLVEPNAFAPVGAPAVRVRFEVTNGHATTLTIHDPLPVAKATLVGG